MKKLLGVTLGITFFLIVWGTVVRSFGAGLACPDWPLCHGQIIPPFDFLVLLEWGHRLIASIVGLLTLTVVIYIFKNREYRKQVGALTFFAFVLLILQAILGGMTVLATLKPLLVTIHLGTGFFFLGLLLWIYLRLKYQKVAATFWHGGGFALLTLLAYVQILLGGWVAANHAGLACPDFPTCFGALVPPLEGLVGYQFFHRVGAFVLLFFLIFYSVCMNKTLKSYFKKQMLVLLKLIVIQIVLGVANIEWELPTWVRIAHMAMAASIFAMLLIATYKARYVAVSQ